MRLGDLIYYITKYTGIKYLVDKYHEHQGTKCKCEDRRKQLNKIKITRKWFSSMKKIIKNGSYFESQSVSHCLPENLKWCASYTQSTKNIVITNPALVVQKQ